ncbi:hypothetical protein HZC00_01685 [Candidatus Kaiserbacteria bacterium]|nr:hypothetical protein [Candidatus Kaiserbacteria bacterium]
MDQTKHPYLLALLGLGSLLIIAAVVETHLPVPVMNNMNEWGTPIAFSSYSPYTSQTAPSSAPSVPTTQATPTNIPSTQDLSSWSYDTAPAPVTSPGNTAATIIKSDTKFDFNAFMQQLAGSTVPQRPSVTTAPLSNTQETYSTVPSQLISTQKDTVSARNDIQQALYVYGNTVGSFIQAYDRLHPNDSKEVQNFFDTHGNAASTIALKQLGTDLKNIGINMKTIASVPPSLLSIHTALADSYIDMGEKLSAQTSTQNDDEVVQMINTYDDAVETYTKNYVALVFKFSENGVVFGPDEPGSLFMFTQ